MVTWLNLAKVATLRQHVRLVDSAMGSLAQLLLNKIRTLARPNSPQSTAIGKMISLQFG